MSLSLREQQTIFAKNIGLLIGYIYSQGYEITLGEAHRTPLQAWVNGLPSGSKIVAETPSGVKVEWTEKVGGIGTAKSLHKLRLAVDLNIFKDGAYLTTEEHHKMFGDYWLTLHELNAWGGAWGDPNHYSMSYQGVK